MVVVNLFGAPGSGKSSGSAAIFAALKQRGVNCELVTEFAKDLTWENNKLALSDQIYVLGQQHYRLHRLRDKVDVAICDSPLLLSGFYNQNKQIAAALWELCIQAHSTFDNLNYLVLRDKPYNPVGRNQTEDESVEIGIQIKRMLDLHHSYIGYMSIEGNQNDYDYVVSEILRKLGGSN